MKKLSIIVPVYKVEKYLNRCIDSIIGQTYSNLEIILVDDGSPDNCPMICDEYAKTDGRIKVIHKQNGGVSSARNAGLDMASGEYIMFIDSDDYIEKDYCEKLIETANQTDGDIVCSNFTELFEDGVCCKKALTKKIEADEELTSKEDMITNCINSCTYTYTIWARIFAKKILKGLYFDINMCFAEDTKFFREAMLRAERITLRTYTGYYYLRNAESVTVNDNIINAFVTDVRVKLELVKQCKDNRLKALPKVVNSCLSSIITTHEMLIKNNLSLQEKKSYLSQLKKYEKEFEKYVKYLKIKMKIQFYLYRYTPHIAVTIRKLCTFIRNEE